MLTTDEILTVGCRAIPHVLKKISTEDPEDRCISISIENFSPYDLEKPEIHYESGSGTSYTPFDVIKPKTVGISSFHSEELLKGTVGILSYHISGLKKKLLVMWSVPFDYNLYKNYVNAKVVEEEIELSSELFEDLYSNAKEDKIDWEDHFFNVKAMIGNDEKTILCVQIYSNFNK